jgi:hypothetical protein
MKKITTGESVWDSLVEVLARQPFQGKPVPYPAVFQYSELIMDGGIAYELLFYEAFFVHCWARTPVVDSTTTTS